MNQGYLVAASLTQAWAQSRDPKAGPPSHDGIWEAFLRYCERLTEIDKDALGPSFEAYEKNRHAQKLQQAHAAEETIARLHPGQAPHRDQ